jgi:hypothetical protein
VHSSLTMSAQNRMRRPDDGVAWRQTPAEHGEACARLRRRSTSSRHCLWAWARPPHQGVAKQLPDCHERPIRCGHRLGHRGPRCSVLRCYPRRPGCWTTGNMWHRGRHFLVQLEVVVTIFLHHCGREGRPSANQT